MSEETNKRAVDPAPFPSILTLTADNPTALEQLAEQYAGELAQGVGLSQLLERSKKAALGAHRMALVVDDESQAQKLLTKAAAGRGGRDVARGTVEAATRGTLKAATAAPKVGFMFTGQGSQSSGMGHGLYQRHSVFREVVDRCEQAARSVLEVPLTAVLFEEQYAPLIDQTGYTQPCLYALECALTDLLGSWGIVPQLVLGHSVGEYAAARAAGVFDLESGMRLIVERGRLMQALPAGGKMAALALSADKAREMVTPYARDLSLAADNGPESAVISGAGPAVDSVLGQFKAEGGRGKELVVSHAFHSPLMEPMLAAFEQFVEEVSLGRADGVTLISNVTASAADGREQRAAYWREHVRAPVLFRQQVDAALAQGVEILVEVGPDPILTGMAMNCVSEDSSIKWVPLMRRGRDVHRSLARGVAMLSANGVEGISAP